LYWINGEAASGKSTLMKYIVAHPTTSRELDRWAVKMADAPRLRVASFSFWAGGTREQRSQSGLLRSILYELLLQEPRLVPVWHFRNSGPLCTPSRWASNFTLMQVQCRLLRFLATR
jgi:hypothetical protein